MDANRTTSGYQLHDELARFCLPEAGRDASRKLAWTNSICILFLLVGLVGARQAANFVEPPPKVEEAVPTIIEPPRPPPTAEVQKIQATDQSQTPAPQVVAVTLNTMAINFAVPAIGNLLVPTALARAPLGENLAARLSVLGINSTGESGDRPQPSYPPIALAEAEQGAVAVAITVDETGAVQQVVLKQSSGYPVLDRGTLEFIKRHWHIQPVNGSLNFETTITYKIATD